jgi:FMN-binding domain
LKAQSANIDMVSGATVTSWGYVKSLQAALDQAVSGQGGLGLVQVKITVQGRNYALQTPASTW